jgi:DNA gyrase inhibitor GyrI
MIIRYTLMWENGGLYCDLQDHQTADAIRATLKEVFREILEGWSKLVSVAGPTLSDPERSRPQRRNH